MTYKRVIEKNPTENKHSIFFNEAHDYTDYKPLKMMQRLNHVSQACSCL